jgi:hypothetical protein
MSKTSTSRTLNSRKRDCMLVATSFVGNPSFIPFHILSLLPRVGRILVIFYVMLSLLSLGLTKGIG